MLRNRAGLDSGDVTSNEQLVPIALKKSPTGGWSLSSGKPLVIGPGDCAEGGENGPEENDWRKMRE